MRPSESARMASAQEAAFRVPYPNSTPRAIKVIALDREAGNVVAALSRKPWNRAVFFNALGFPAVAADAPATDRQRASSPPASSPPVSSPNVSSPNVSSPNVSGQARLTAWLADVAGHARDLVAEIDNADVIVVIASPGTDASTATIIGEACRHRHKSMIGLILQTANVSDEALSRTLLGMRPLATMLVVASGSEYVEEMLASMRA